MNLHMKDICPICSSILLRHIHQSKLTWFCPGCRQQMPNFNSKSVLNISNKSLDQRVTKNSKTIIYFQDQANQNSQIVGKSLSWLESFIDEGKIRLDIVGFIIKKTKSIINNAVVISANLSSETLEHNVEHHLQLRKVACLRDAEIILLYICYAILQQNSDLLNNQYLKDLKETYAALNIPVYQQVRVINLMKDSVMSFVSHRTFNFLESTSEQNCSNLTLEIASYFDTVVDCIT